MIASKFSSFTNTSFLFHAVLHDLKHNYFLLKKYREKFDVSSEGPSSVKYDDFSILFLETTNSMKPGIF
jgi:hypothetical protein